MMLLNFRHCFTFYISFDLPKLISIFQNYLHAAKHRYCIEEVNFLESVAGLELKTFSFFLEVGS